MQSPVRGLNTSAPIVTPASARSVELFSSAAPHRIRPVQKQKQYKRIENSCQGRSLMPCSAYAAFHAIMAYVIICMLIELPMPTQGRDTEFQSAQESIFTKKRDLLLKDLAEMERVADVFNGMLAAQYDRINEQKQRISQHDDTEHMMMYTKEQWIALTTQWNKDSAEIYLLRQFVLPEQSL